MFEMGVVVTVIIALGQFSKQYVPTKYIPAVTLGLGVIGGMFFIPHTGIREAILNGVIAGLTSNGMYDVSKSIHVSSSNNETNVEGNNQSL